MRGWKVSRRSSRFCKTKRTLCEKSLLRLKTRRNQLVVVEACRVGIPKEATSVSSKAKQFKKRQKPRPSNGSSWSNVQSKGRPSLRWAGNYPRSLSWSEISSLAGSLPVSSGIPLTTACGRVFCARFQARRVLPAAAFVLKSQRDATDIALALNATVDAYSGVTARWAAADLLKQRGEVVLSPADRVRWCSLYPLPRIISADRFHIACSFLFF